MFVCATVTNGMNDPGDEMPIDNSVHKHAATKGKDMLDL
jgi:hypothetical protein